MWRKLNKLQVKVGQFALFFAQFVDLLIGEHRQARPCTKYGTQKVKKYCCNCWGCYRWNCRYLHCRWDRILDASPTSTVKSVQSSPVNQTGPHALNLGCNHRLQWLCDFNVDPNGDHKPPDKPYNSYSWLEYPFYSIYEFDRG